MTVWTSIGHPVRGDGNWPILSRDQTTHNDYPTTVVFWTRFERYGDSTNQRVHGPEEHRPLQVKASRPPTRR